MGRQPGQSPAILSRSLNSVVFSHGKESGPWGAKITAMAAVARDLGFDVESVDYRSMDDPLERVKKLIGVGAGFQAPVLVGSSMGGHVAAAAAGALGARALFLLAPAFYMPGLEKYTPQDVGGVPTAIVHGWHDDIVPVENSIRWAREHQAALHVLNSHHRLEDQIETICALLRNFLAGLRSP
jgi:pimeloyl-ACP methyl ester carboxylesterase